MPTFFRTHRAPEYLVLQEQGLPALFLHENEKTWNTFDPEVSDALGPLEPVPETEVAALLASRPSWKDPFRTAPMDGLSALAHFYGASIEWRQGRAVHVVMPPWHNLEGVEEALQKIGLVMVPLPWHGRDDGFIARGIRQIHDPHKLAESVAGKLTKEQRLGIAGVSVVDSEEWAKGILAFLRGVVSIHTMAGWDWKEIHAFLVALQARACVDAAERGEEMPHERCARGIHEPMQGAPETCVYCDKPVVEARV